MTKSSTVERPAVPPAGATRPTWWHEPALVLGTYGAYTLTRNTLPAHRARARANALDLLHAEQHLHLDVEHSLNDAVAGHGTNWLSVLANYTYSLTHLGVTLTVLVWLYVARAHVYRPARTALLVATTLGLIGFWLFPLAPPRFFPELGFVDTVVRDGTWGSWGSNAVADTSNEYAAMPSIHLVWALWSAGVLVLWARPLWLRAVAALYPVVVVLVILSTANHWALDAVGGLVAVSAGALVGLLLARRLTDRRRRPTAGRRAT